MENNLEPNSAEISTDFWFVGPVLSHLICLPRFYQVCSAVIVTVTRLDLDQKK